MQDSEIMVTKHAPVMITRVACQKPRERKMAEAACEATPVWFHGAFCCRDATSPLRAASSWAPVPLLVWEQQHWCELGDEDGDRRLCRAKKKRREAAWEAMMAARWRRRTGRGWGVLLWLAGGRRDGGVRGCDRCGVVATWWLRKRERG